MRRDVFCLWRLFSGVFEKAGIEVTREKRKELVRILRGIAVSIGFALELKVAWETENLLGIKLV